MGLIKAAKNFDAALGYSFSTYAVPVILGEIKRIFRDTGPIKISRSIKELSYKVQKAKDLLAAELGREPSVSEIAEHLKVSAEEVAQAVCAGQPVVSITSENDDGDIQMDIPDGDGDNGIIEKITVKSALEKLTENDRKIIVLRYYREKTQSETALALGMTQVQVSRREKKILTELKKMLA